MGAQSCQKTAAAFLIWKREAKIPVDFAYDNQERLQGLIRLGRIVSKHMHIGKMVSLAHIQQHACDQE